MEEAVADYDQAIASLPEDATLLRARAHAQQRLGNFTRATADINRAIQLSPHDPELLTQRGSLAAEQGKFDHAQDDFRQAIKIAPNFGDAYRSLAWLQATCPDPKYRDPKQALSSAKKAATLSSPDDYLLLDTQAAANAGAGQFDQAVELQQKALAAAPADAATPLQQRLALYQRQQIFTSAPVKSDVRTVSHETPAKAKVASRPATQQYEIAR
jgi:Flp pilus assembly protein TadD